MGHKTTEELPPASAPSKKLPRRLREPPKFAIRDCWQVIKPDAFIVLKFRGLESMPV
jgi:hypothetical protein